MKGIYRTRLCRGNLELPPPPPLAWPLSEMGGKRLAKFYIFFFSLLCTCFHSLLVLNMILTIYASTRNYKSFVIVNCLVSDRIYSISNFLLALLESRELIQFPFLHQEALKAQLRIYLFRVIMASPV